MDPDSCQIRLLPGIPIVDIEHCYVHPETTKCKKGNKIKSKNDVKKMFC